MWLRHVQAPAPRPVPAKDIPSHLRVCCGTMRGNFDVQRALVILDGGREISPTEFERMAGKAASKKWKASVRIDKVRSCPASADPSCSVWRSVHVLGLTGEPAAHDRQNPISHKCLSARSK